MPRENLEQKKDRARKIFQHLAQLYPNAQCALVHGNPLELLVATILSAQCTDVRVNMVTPALFKKYPTAQALADADRHDLEKIVQTTGFFRSKAKSIQETAKSIVLSHGGRVPDTMDELVALRGVGRKTANVVLGNAFNKNEGIVVDTHVSRLSQRLVLTKNTTPEKIEQDLTALIPRERWTLLSHLLIFHGRQVCFARNPKCPGCKINALCPSAFKLDARSKGNGAKNAAGVKFRMGKIPTW